MELIIDFPGSSRVDAHFGRFTEKIDQLPTASVTSQLDVFLSSIGTCAGIYVLEFYQRRGLSTEGMKVVERVSQNAKSGMVDKIHLEILLDPNFP